MLAPHAPLRATPSELAAITRLEMRAADAADADDNSPRRRGRPPGTLLAGVNPNIHWRAISSESLRSHPRVIGLPPAEGIQLAGPSTFWWVRQDDPLWDELHKGVLTSRHLLSALGMREPRAAAVCGIPRACSQMGAIGNAWHMLRASSSAASRLATPPDRVVASADESNEALRAAFVEYRRKHRDSGHGELGWPPRTDGLPNYSNEEMASEARAMGAERDIGLVRRCWGSAQEAAALAALIQAQPRAATLEEIGLAMLTTDGLPDSLPQELRDAHERGELPPLGASPDAMLRPRPGAPLEVVEVKNVCPFLPPEERDGDTFSLYPRYVHERHGRNELPFWRLRGPHQCLPTQYVPQVMVEMLVTGAPSAMYVSTSATQGMSLLRVQRDDVYIAELLHFLRAFWRSVQRSDTPPTDEFFWSGESDVGQAGGRKSGELVKANERYRRFLERTKKISRSSTVERHIGRPWRREASGAGRLFFIDD